MPWVREGERGQQMLAATRLEGMKNSDSSNQENITNPHLEHALERLLTSHRMQEMDLRHFICL